MFSLRKIIFTLIILALIAIVWRRGGWPERAGAAAMIMAAALTAVAQDRPNWLEPQIGILAVDLGLFVALTAIALTSDRWWPLWAAGFQLVGVFIHLATIIDPVVLPHAYYRALSIYTYPVILALAIGTLRRSKPS